jgi:hypothetical protein
MVFKGGAAADGWSGKPTSHHILEANNRTNEPPARLVCDWTHAPYGELQRATLKLSGQARRVVIEDATNLTKIREAITQGIVQHVCKTLGVDQHAASTIININNYFNYHHNNFKACSDDSTKDDDSVRPTKFLADILLSNNAFENCVEFGPNDYAVFNTNTGLWTLKRTRDNAAAVASDIVKAWYTEKPQLFNKKEFRHILTGTNIHTMLRCIAGKLEREREIIHKFDEITPSGSLPFKNGMFVSADRSTRPFIKDDLITCTVGYDFVPFSNVSQDDVAFVNDFYTKIFPDQHERELFLQLVGFALFGNAASKHFLVLTDLRDGYNGKSTLMKFIAKTFGDLARKDRQILVCERQEDPNAHQTGILAFKAKRLCWVEEPSENSKLDIAKLKDLSGGQATFEGRVLHSAVNVKLTWRALIVITANENALPIMEAAGDMAFLKRLIAINMRSKFVESNNHELTQPNTFVLDSDIDTKLATRIAANVLILFEAYSQFVANGGVVDLPEASQQFIDRLVIQADPLMPIAKEFIELNCRQVQGGFVRKTVLERRFDEFLDTNVSTMHFNKHKRQRNKVLKSAVCRGATRFQGEIHHQGQRIYDVLINIELTPELHLPE